jgi:hypothetical protein
MREYPLMLRMAISAGIAPTKGVDIMGLFSAKNAVPMGKGMEFKQPFSSYLDLAISWPFTQLIVTDKFKYACYGTGIYEIVAGVLVLKKSQVATEHYDCADFKDSIVLTGANKTYVRDATGALVSGTNAPEANACCSFDGLLVLGNIYSWNQISNISTDSIAWANRLLSADFTMHVDNVATGAGYMRLFCGAIKKIVTLDKKLYVFGTKKVVVLELQQAPLPTFGIVKEYDIAVSSKMAVASGEAGIAFISALGELYLIEAGKGEPQKVGFERFFEGESVCCSYNPYDREFYLSTDTQTLVLTEDGMGQLDQAITSCGYDGTSVCVIAGTPTTEDFELVVGPVDMRTTANKVLYAQSVYGESDQLFQIGVEWQKDTRAAMSDAGYVSAGPEGMGTRIVQGIAFLVKIKAVAPTTAVVYDYSLRWKLVDKRGVRGFYDYKTASGERDGELGNY